MIGAPIDGFGWPVVETVSPVPVRKCHRLREWCKRLQRAIESVGCSSRERERTMPFPHAAVQEVVSQVPRAMPVAAVPVPPSSPSCVGLTDLARSLKPASSPFVGTSHQSAATEDAVEYRWKSSKKITCYDSECYCNLTFPEGVYVGAPVKYWHKFQHLFRDAKGFLDKDEDITVEKKITECDGGLTSLQGYEMCFEWELNIDEVWVHLPGVSKEKKSIDVSYCADQWQEEEWEKFLVPQVHKSAATEVGIAVEWNSYSEHLNCKLTFPEGVYVGAPAKYWHRREYNFDSESIMGFYGCDVDITECDGVLTSLQGCEMCFKWESDDAKESIDVTNWWKSRVPQQRVLQIHAELNNGTDLLVEAMGLDGSSVAKFTIDFRDTLGSLRSHLGQKLSASTLVSGSDIISDTDDSLIINTKLVRGTVLQAQVETAYEKDMSEDAPVV